MTRKRPVLAVQFGAWLDPLMGELNASGLARQLGLTPDQVSKMRRGLRKPQPHELPTIENFVGEKWPDRHLLMGPEHRQGLVAQAAQASRANGNDEVLLYLREINTKLDRLMFELGKNER